MASKTHLLITSALAGFIATPAFAQDAVDLEPIVVSASQVPVAASKTGSSVTVITAQEIETRGHDTLSDVLRTVPGVAVSQQGTRGSLSQARVRGGEANHTLVLIDGIEVNSLGNGFFDFADFLAGEIERVEVLRGPQSGIYGAGAHSGVISVFTKSGRGLNGARAQGVLEGGSFGTGRAAASIQAGNGQAYGALNVEGYRADGFNISRFGSERDGSDAIVASAKVGVDVTPDLNIEGVIRHTDRSAQTDPQDYNFPPGPTYGFTVDGDNFNQNRVTIGRIAATHSSLGGRWMNTTSASFLDERVEFEDEPSAAFPNTFSSNGERYDLEHKSAFKIDTAAFGGERHTLTAKIDYREEQFDYVSAFTTAQAAGGVSRDRVGIAGEYLLDLPTMTTLSAAVRHEWNDGFEDTTTWRLTASQRFRSATRVHASIGTGVTNPTFIEQFGIFGNFVGNPDLRPEESLGWDIGVEQSFFGDRLVLDATYFASRLEDEIRQVFPPFPAPSSLVNDDGRSKRDGVELTATVKPTDWLDLSASYTYTDARRASGDRALRRPPHAASFDATARFLEDRARASVGVVYNGTMDDVGPVGTTRLGAYTLVNARIAYDVTKEVTVFARAENVFDDDYEEVFSYRAPGFAAFAGVKVALGGE